MFLWGVATSAYQIEGAAENDWTEWERAGRLRERDARCGEASGHRARWQSDFALLPSLGVNAYRYSVERSVLEPEPGRFAEAALSLESERAAALRRLGIEPCVTLHHYTHPRWFWASGGWQDPRSVDGFRRFAEAVADALAPHVRLWVTLNEPIVFLLGGYLGGKIPPGLTSFSAAARALEHLLLAHREAAAAIRDRPPAAASASRTTCWSSRRSAAPARSIAGSRSRRSGSTTSRCSRRSPRGGWTGPSRGRAGCARGSTGSRPRTTSSASTTTAASTSASAACPARSANTRTATRWRAA